MGTDKAAGGGAPMPLDLPRNLPKELRDFIECRTNTATIANGPLEWVELPDEAKAFLGKNAKPQLSVKPGATPTTATLAVKVGFLSISLPASVSGGKLSIDTSQLPGWAPASVATDVRKFVDGLNGSLGANGKGLGPPSFSANGMTLSKVPLPGSQTTNPPPPPPPPAPPVTPPPAAAKHSADTGSEPPPYLDTPIPPPPLPKAELFGPNAGKAGTAPDAVDGIVDAAAGFAPVVGAGGPGGAKAPRGLGDLARYAIAATIVAAIGLGAFLFLGTAGPGAPVAATASPGPLPTAASPTAAAPTANVAPTAPVVVATPPPAATPNGVPNGRFEVLEDTRISSCEHTYLIEFRVFDSALNGAVYAGKEAIFQVLDGQQLTTTIGPEGTWQVETNEVFQKTNSGCFSRLAPKVISVDGQPAF